ncbi:O-methyltransferase [Lacticigenium naphthae]|uniref:O-methyltransferase n=1 Tax=Lacticigenium naphthae TaxID=515351 RepID=UPI000429B8DC|nr:O-methyltransferase [Lacticigenium naphthae]
MRKLNEMMDRPVIDKAVRDYLRTKQRQLTGPLGAIENEANKKRVPVIPHETVRFLEWFLPLYKPVNILEIGTAIGFSAGLMAQFLPDEGQITTIERNPTMIEKAEKNFKKMKNSNKISLIKGQAEEVLQELDESYDFIFMDSAKAKYYDFFPHCMRVLKVGGVIAIDDVLQGGTILQETENIPRSRKKIHKKLNQFLEVVLNHPALNATILPLGDGLLMITKEEDADFSFMLKKRTDQHDDPKA